MKKLALIALALLAMLAMASPASARGGDANRDGLPDRWEKRHHLSLKVKQAKRDQDKDGLNNRGEFRAKTDPRDDDTDNDGTEDGDENAGTIKSFEGGILTITLAEGGELAAKVDDDTEIECHGPGDLRAHSSHDEGDDEHGDDEHGDDEDHEHGDHEHGDHEHGDHEDGDDVNEHGEDDDDRCADDALKAGTKVHEAELEISSKGKRWEELELLAS